jgi:ketosteroid isomerase-like protein
MTSREAMMAAITHAYEVRDKGDIAGVLDVFHQDARFQLAGARRHLRSSAPSPGMPPSRRRSRT